MGAGFTGIAAEFAHINKKLDEGLPCRQADRISRLETNMKWLNRIGTSVIGFLLWLNHQALWHSIQRALT